MNNNCFLNCIGLSYVKILYFRLRTSSSLSSSVVSSVDLFNSVESSDVSEFISEGNHEVGDTSPGGWGDIDSSVNESLVAF